MSNTSSPPYCSRHRPPWALPLNWLLITAHDLGCDAMGFLDGKVPDVTANLSNLASKGLSF